MRVFILLLSGLFLFPLSSKASPLEGYWLTQNERSVIKIESCKKKKLCGSVYWVIDGGMQNDIHNPDYALRAQPICGLKILWNFTESDTKNKWSGGTIYKADEGDFYDAYLQLLNDNTIKLRGYISLPLLGKTQYWTRVSDLDQYPHCTPHILSKEEAKTLTTKKGEPHKPASLNE